MKIKDIEDQVNDFTNCNCRKTRAFPGVEENSVKSYSICRQF